MKYKIEVEIKNIDVDNRYYSFEYIIRKDGKVIMEKNYENDYQNGMTEKEFKEFLKGSYALGIALVQYGEML